MPTSTYAKIATITLTSTDSEVVFSNIPASYRDLVLVADGLTNSSPAYFYMRLNGNTSNYSRVEMFGTGSTASSFSAANLIPITFTTSRGTNIAQIMDYNATDKHKTVLYRNDSSAGVIAGAGRWGSTSAVNSVSLVQYSATEFAISTTFSLYGISA